MGSSPPLPGLVHARCSSIAATAKQINSVVISPSKLVLALATHFILVSIHYLLKTSNLHFKLTSNNFFTRCLFARCQS